ncbi:hypothetical protein B0J13DRAFT_526581 [Dactylonectria estremocensis]|uniref:Uncharacterized protein n=1 Tax=Dactylonectria estremocensis TaxID=1079267 RepID=A0A9P9EKU2_9HYPO|nr:hypothetical protein B0J13DRAFT_526581 [Dactylonectria estremocensis]
MAAAAAEAVQKGRQRRLSCSIEFKRREKTTRKPQLPADCLRVLSTDDDDTLLRARPPSFLDEVQSTKYLSDIPVRRLCLRHLHSGFASRKYSGTCTHQLPSTPTTPSILNAIHRTPSRVAWDPPPSTAHAARPSHSPSHPSHPGNQKGPPSQACPANHPRLRGPIPLSSRPGPRPAPAHGQLHQLRDPDPSVADRPRATEDRPRSLRTIGVHWEPPRTSREAGGYHKADPVIHLTHSLPLRPLKAAPLLGV